jgi:hypothetical protein
VQPAAAPAAAAWRCVALQLRSFRPSWPQCRARTPPACSGACSWPASSSSLQVGAAGASLTGVATIGCSTAGCVACSATARRCRLSAWLFRHTCLQRCSGTVSSLHAYHASGRPVITGQPWQHCGPTKPTPCCRSSAEPLAAGSSGAEPGGRAAACWQHAWRGGAALAARAALPAVCSCHAAAGAQQQGALAGQS